MTTQLKFIVELKSGEKHVQHVETHPDAVHFITAKLTRFVTKEVDV